MRETSVSFFVRFFGKNVGRVGCDWSQIVGISLVIFVISHRMNDGGYVSCSASILNENALWLVVENCRSVFAFFVANFCENVL